MNPAAPAGEDHVQVLAGATALRRAAWGATLLVLGLGYAREIAAAATGAPSYGFGFRQLQLDAEASLPAWYSSVLMLLSALLMLAVARADHSLAGRPTRRHWAGLGVLFVLLSVDESILLHEQLIVPLRLLLGVGGPFFFAWVVAGLGLVVVLGLVYLPFLLRVRRRTAAGLLLAGSIYLAGALGLEMLGGYVYERFGPTPYYVFVALCEETLELVGLTVLFGVLVAHAAAVLPPVRLAGGGSAAS